MRTGINRNHPSLLFISKKSITYPREPLHSCQCCSLFVLSCCRVSETAAVRAGRGEPSWKSWKPVCFSAALLLSLSLETEKLNFNYIIVGLLSMTFDVVCFSILLLIPQIYSPLDSFISSNQFHANFMKSPFALVFLWKSTT